MPFTRRAHVDACVEEGAVLVVFHGGLPGRWLPPLRRAGIPVLVTVGTTGPGRACTGSTRWSSQPRRSPGSPRDRDAQSRSCWDPTAGVA